MKVLNHSGSAGKHPDGPLFESSYMPTAPRLNWDSCLFIVYNTRCVWVSSLKPLKSHMSINGGPESVFPSFVVKPSNMFLLLC